MNTVFAYFYITVHTFIPNSYQITIDLLFKKMRQDKILTCCIPYHTIPFHTIPQTKQIFSIYISEAFIQAQVHYIKNHISFIHAGIQNFFWLYGLGFCL
jgi:hypothetical protein